jgi:hypothetical protein
MIENKILLILFLFFFSSFVNIFLLRIFYRRFFFIEIGIFILVFFFYFININYFTYQFLYFFILYITLYAVYAFTIIMPFDGSPSLKIIEIIYDNRKIKKKALLKKFLINSFIKNRLKKLIKSNYVGFVNDKIFIKKKIFLIKFFINIQNLQNFKKSLNG